MAKKNETPQEEVMQETPVVETEEVVETPQEEPAQAKVYKFTSSNKYLTVAHLGIQFREGKASTTNLEIAKALARVGGVELVED